MDRRTLLKGAAAGTLAAPALSLPLCAQSTPEQARFDAFADALEAKPWLRGFVGAQVLQTQTAMETVHGQMPEGLQGALFRNGPAYHDIGGERFGHWFDAPGMVQKYTIGANGVQHKGRLIETARNRRELTQQRMLFEAFGTKRTDLGSGGSADGQNVGNISILHHAGELMATWEGGSAHVLDSETLETVGRKDWSLETTGAPFSAHTRHDPDGNLWSIGYSIAPAGLLLYHIDAAGALQQVRAIPFDAAPMIHDFVVTATKLVVLVPPLQVDHLDEEASILGLYSWHGDQPTRALIFDKADLSLTQEIELDPFWVFHFGNGYDSGPDEITLDLTLHETPDFMLDTAFAMMDGSWDGHVSTEVVYTQIRLNLRTGRSQIETVPELQTAEFLKIDPRASLGDHRHTLMLTLRQAERDAAAPPWFGQLALYDRHRERLQTYRAADTEMMEEHVMVPKASGGDGVWLLGSSQDWAEGATYLSVYDGAALAAGPVYRARLEGTLPLGLHGHFVSG